MALLIDQVRRVISWHNRLLAADHSVRLLDRAPITLAASTGGGDNRTLTGAEYFGVASSKSATLFGLRLHVTTTGGQVVDAWLLAPAALHDTTPMGALFEQATWWSWEIARFIVRRLHQCCWSGIRSRS